MTTCDLPQTTVIPRRIDGVLSFVDIHRDMPELILSMKGREVTRAAITKNRTIIGRSPQADLVIDNAGVSRHHAVVVASAGAFVVMDQGSQNGIFVNNRPVDEVELRHGDTIQIGKFEVTFSDKGGVAESRLEAVQDPASKFQEVIQAGDDKTFALSAEEVARVMERAALGGGPQKPRASPRRTTSSVRMAVAERANQKGGGGGGKGGLIALLVILVLGLGGALAYVLLNQ